MVSRKLFWIGTLAVAVVGLLTGALLAAHPSQPTGPRAKAAWKMIYPAPGPMVRDVDAIVLARAVDIKPGRTAESDNGEDSLRFELASFDVIRGLKGVETGERITLERAAESGDSVFLDHDGGSFEAGQRYLLFLKHQEDGGPYFYQVNDQGRFRVANDRLVAVQPGDRVAAQFHQRPVAEGLRLVRANLREGARVR